MKIRLVFLFFLWRLEQLVYIIGLVGVWQTRSWSFDHWQSTEAGRGQPAFLITRAAHTKERRDGKSPHSLLLFPLYGSSATTSCSCVCVFFLHFPILVSFSLPSCWLYDVCSSIAASILQLNAFNKHTCFGQHVGTDKPTEASWYNKRRKNRPNREKRAQATFEGINLPGVFKSCAVRPS